MKKILILLLIFSLAVGLIGCSSKSEEETMVPVEITTKSLEEMPEYVAQYLEQEKQTENYQAIDVNGSMLLFAARGEMNTGGYDISFGKAGIMSDKLYVEVNTTDPKEGEEVTEAINYPIALGEITANNLPTTVVFVEADDYESVLKEVVVKELPQPEESVVYLYFGTKDGYLRKEPRTIKGLPTGETGEELIQELIEGTKAEDDTLNVLPKGTKLLDYQYKPEEELAVVDLSQEIHGAVGSMGETFAVYSIVNSLTELPGIEKVQFLVEGEKVESLSGHIYLMEPMERTLEFIEGNMQK